MIHRAKFQNFKALRDVEITFDSRLTVLVGPNGSGKTSVLKGIELLGNMAAGRSAKEVFSGNFAPEVTWSGRGDESQSLSVTADAEGGSQIVTRMVATHGTIDNPQPWKLAREFLIESSGQLQPLPNNNAVPNNALQNVALLRLDPNKIAAASSVTQVPPSTGSDGTGTASTLAYLHRKQPEHFAQAVGALKRVIPNVLDLIVDYEPANGHARDVLKFHFLGAPEVRAADASTGTLLVAGLFSILYGPKRPNVVLLDDLDYALHPKAQLELVELLRGVLDELPEVQIIATAHSPYILDRLDWREVQVTSLSRSGAAICKPLTAHPDFERWKDSMSPGEFWGTFYEDWLTKPRNPQPVA